MELSSLVWLILIVVFVVLEGLTISMVSIWFCAGALVSLVISLFLPDAILVQVLAFAAVSILCLLALRPLARRWVDTRRVPTNADANIGKIGLVISEVQPGRVGRVRLESLDWSARSDTLLPVGSRCLVIGLEGVKLIVVPADDFSSKIEHPEI